MSAATDLMEDALSRIKETVHAVTDGLSAEDLAFRPTAKTNSIAWLVWHLARVQDDHIAEVAGRPQVWTTQGWAGQFGLPLSDTDTGYGHTSEQAGAVRVESPKLLTGYYDAVHEQTLGYVRAIADPDLEAIVDDRWDPPVTLAARLVSVINDDTMHAGQAGYVRGLLSS